MTQAKHTPINCAFCFPSQQGKNGMIKREWSIEWTMFIPLCRIHAQENETLNSNLLALEDTDRKITEGLGPPVGFGYFPENE